MPVDIDDLIQRKLEQASENDRAARFADFDRAVKLRVEAARLRREVEAIPIPCDGEV